MDQAMAPRPVASQQASKSIFHRTCDGGKDMSLDSRQVDDIYPNHRLRDEQTFGEYLIQHQEGGFWTVLDPFHCRIISINTRDGVFISNIFMLVVLFGIRCVHYDCIIVNTNQIGITSTPQGSNN